MQGEIDRTHNAIPKFFLNHRFERHAVHRMISKAVDAVRWNDWSQALGGILGEG
jgi:hypothetical protein